VVALDRWRRLPKFTRTFKLRGPLATLYHRMPTGDNTRLITFWHGSRFLGRDGIGDFFRLAFALEGMKKPGGAAGFLSGLRINEWMNFGTKPWLELFNTANKPVI